MKLRSISNELRAGRNPKGSTTPKRCGVLHHKYERTGASVRFVEFNGHMLPLALDIERAMYPNNTDEWCSPGLAEGVVLIKGEARNWIEMSVPASIVTALEIADNAFYRIGMDAVRDANESAAMRDFIVANVSKVSENDVGLGHYPDFDHTFGNREILCMSYTGADTGGEAIAEVEAAYREIVALNQLRDAQPKKERIRASTAKVEFTQQEVCRRAMAVHECEGGLDAARGCLISFATVYKCQHGIERLDFADEHFQEFSRHALRDRWDAERDLRLARARLKTATRGYAAVIAKFGCDPYQKLADRALAILAYDERLSSDGPIVLTCSLEDAHKLEALRSAVVEGNISMKDALAEKFSDDRPMLTREQFIELTLDETHIPA